MMTINANTMFKKTIEANLTDMEKMRCAVEERIKRAADAGLFETSTHMAVEGKYPTEHGRDMMVKWLQEAGYTVHVGGSDPDLVKISWRDQTMQNNDYIGPRTSVLLESLKGEGFITILNLVHDEVHIELKRIDGVNRFNIEQYNEIHQRILTAIREDLNEDADAIRANWRERFPSVSRFWNMCQGKKNGK